MNEILKELSRMHDDLIDLMKDEPDWENQKKNIEILDSLDARQIGRSMVKDLVNAFAFWMDSQMTGLDSPIPLGCVYFEYSYQNFEATAYGYEICKPKEGDVFIKREVYDFEDHTFYDCGGVVVLDIMDLNFEDESTEFTDLQSFKAAEALHYGLEEAIKSEAFENLTKKNKVYFLIGQHDRWPALAYIWKK